VATIDTTAYVFARGDDDHLYWGNSTAPGVWHDAGGSIGSSPAAVSLGNGKIMLSFIGLSSGKMVRASFDGQTIGTWVYTSGGSPSGNGAYASPDGWIGPAIASRTPGSFDIFMYDANGKLYSVSYYQGEGWGPWQLLDIPVPAFRGRPAATAIQDGSVVLGLVQPSSTAFDVLSEWKVTFSSAAPERVAKAESLDRTTPVQRQSAAGLAARSSSSHPYRVIAVDPRGILMHRMANDAKWRRMGGRPMPSTGASVAATGPYAADIVMNARDQVGCDGKCQGTVPKPDGQFIQPGGIWLRRFE
jgi:hypothetical protein